MNTLEKLRVLGASAAYDSCGCETSDKNRRRIDVPRDGIYPATGKDGRKTLLLKVLQSNECSGDCAYCVNTCTRETTRASFEAEELANLFTTYQRQGLVEGLFLSSGVGRDPEGCMDEVLSTVELVRRRGFRGYVHTKVLPGASRDQVVKAARLSTRLSINVEVPGKVRLSELSSTKDFRLDILRRMKWVKREVALGNLHGGQTTQFIVGASGEADCEILSSMDYLYDRIGVYRCYFSAFSPIKDTPLESAQAAPSIRAHRLYQSDFLLRQYDFDVDDIPLSDEGFLSLTRDPKTLFAQANPERYPVDLNEADYSDLLKVPGVGPKTAGKIISTREAKVIRGIRDFKALGIMRKSLPYLELSGLKQKRIYDYT